MNTLPIAVLVAVLIALLLISAFFSMSETALLSASRVRLQRLAREGQRGAARALQLLARTDHMLGVILIGNNFVNVASASLSTVVMFRLFGQNDWVLGMATLIVTLAILVFSEATPKIFAAQHAERIACLCAHPLIYWVRLVSPINYVLHRCVHALLRLLGAGPAQEIRLSTEELKLLALESTHFSQSVHQNLLGKLLDLERYTVDDVMVPRRRIEWINLNDSYEHIRHRLSTAHHSRLLACEDDLDHSLGILSVRKALSLLDDDWSVEELQRLIPEALAILPGTPLLSVVQLFQTQHQRMALVVDEYGDLLGILTLEDILETLVGQFTSQAPKQYSTSSEHYVDVDASLTLHELEQQTQLKIASTDAKTLNGWIIHYLGDIPEANTCLKIDTIQLEILQADARSIQRVRIFKT